MSNANQQESRKAVRKAIKGKTKDDSILRIMSLNVTSWKSIQTRLKEWRNEADLIAMQEVKLNRREQVAATLIAKGNKWNVMHGKHRQITSCGLRKGRQGWRTKAGGVAIIAKEHLSMLPTGRAWKAARDLYASTRCIRAAVMIQNEEGK